VSDQSADVCLCAEWAYDTTGGPGIICGGATNGAGLRHNAISQAAPTSLGPEAVYPHDSDQQSAGCSAEGVA